MDSDREEAEVFADTEDPSPVRAEEEDEEDEEREEEEEDEDEEEDAKIFDAWMQRYRSGEKVGDDKEDQRECEGGRAESRSSIGSPLRLRTDRRASLPCPVREQH